MATLDQNITKVFETAFRDKLVKKYLPQIFCLSPEAESYCREKAEDFLALKQEYVVFSTLLSHTLSLWKERYGERVITLEMEKEQYEYFKQTFEEKYQSYLPSRIPSLN